MNILSVISSTKLKEINIKGFNGFFTLNNLYYSTNLSTHHQGIMDGWTDSSGNSILVV